MPILFIYLCKLSVSLAVVYLFYRISLQYVTFYDWNRWYLFGYSILSFLIPFINISTVLEQNNWSEFKAVQVIPAINDFTSKKIVTPAPSAPALPNVSDLLLVIFFTGMVIMLVRLIFQWISYLNIQRKAKLLFKDEINLYEVSETIVPFSFGRSVFINHQSHNQEELKKILRHEYVHVKQKHTIDIVWAEILCLFNWYNPFAWLIRYHIRQNLEFIADNKVLENGIDKKQYQYLLLKVIGISQFSIATPFNFSSLKKRIVMMNKMKSAKVHLVKFLFVLPLLAVLLIAFRSRINKDKSPLQNDVITVSGIVVQGDNYERLSNVHFKEATSKIEGNTDERGFYTFTFPVSSYPQAISILFTKEGFTSMESKSQISNKNKLNSLNRAEFIGMTSEKTERKSNNSFIHSTSLTGTTTQQPVYEIVLKKFEEMKRNRDEGLALQEQSRTSQHPYWIINGHSYVLTAGGGSASLDTITNIVIVDGKKMTGEEVNATIKRSSIQTVGAMNKEVALKKYAIDDNVLEINVNPEYTRTRINNNTRAKTEEAKNDSKIEEQANKANNLVVEVAAKELNKEKLPDTTKIFDPSMLVILDGQKMTWREYEAKKIPRTDLAFASFISEGHKKLVKYGEEGKNGVAIFTTKQNKAGEDQTSPNVPEEKKFDKPIYYGAEIRPTYPGGKEAFLKYIATNLKYPQEAMTKKIEVPVSIRFIVDVDGTLKNFNPSTRWGYGLEEEAIRLIKNSGKWIPGKYNGKSVPCSVGQTIEFAL